MRLGRITRVLLPVHRLLHSHVDELTRGILRSRPGKLVVLNLRHTMQTTTAALAALIILRRKLMDAGSDLLIWGLCGQANWLYEICRMHNLLPRRQGRSRGTHTGIVDEQADVEACTAA
ncbi:MAG: hypothetical protein HZA50_02560 [Planctomycetes bacterium]|nr:hypothetical protein [Planctomycetota bacterium]